MASPLPMPATPVMIEEMISGTISIFRAFMNMLPRKE